MPAWIATTMSVITGGVLAMFAAWLADRRLTQRDRERHREERHERFIIRRNDFQRETLLALQNASQRLLRTTGAMHHQDVVEHHKSGQWQRQQFSDDLSNDNLKWVTETILLASRIRDDEVRTLADRLRYDASAVTMSSDRSEAESRMMAAAHTQKALIQRIGQLVRELDEID